MQGNPIETVLSAIQQFIQLKLRTKGGNQHTVSSILFDVDACTAFCQSRINNQSLFLTAPECRGGTNFRAALQEVIEVLDNCSPHSLNVIIFMTDGGTDFSKHNKKAGAYPEREMAVLNSPPYLAKIDSFYGIVLGADPQKILKSMAEAMGTRGYYRNPADIVRLVQEYLEIAKMS